MNALLLRGLSREQRHWGKFPSILGARLQGEVFCLDLPGAGTEFQRPSPNGLPLIMEDVRARWTALRDSHSGPWVLIGMSLGGMVAMQWGATYASDFATIVLCNTSASNLSSPWERINVGVLRAMTSGDPVERERIILAATTRLTTDLDAIAREWATYQVDQPVSRMNVLRQLWAASRFTAPSSLPVPTLVLSGGDDPLTSPACSRRLANHFHAVLKVHPTAGHELALDSPDWFADSIAEWLETIEPPTRAGA